MWLWRTLTLQRILCWHNFLPSAWGMKLVLRLGLVKVGVESDSLEAISLIHRSSDSQDDAATWVKDIKISVE